jgi:hypothetical protein
VALSHSSPERLGRGVGAGRLARGVGELLDRFGVGVDPRPASVPTGRAKLELELVAAVEAPVSREQRVARWLGGVVDLGVELRDSPTEPDGGGQPRLGRRRLGSSADLLLT